LPQSRLLNYGIFLTQFPRKWVLVLHEKSKEAIGQYLAGSESRVTLFFDIWTGSGKVPILEVCCNMVDTDYKQQIFLLTLPEIKEPAEMPILPENCYDSLTAFSLANDL
jgi:hypothetical protein